MNEKMIRRIVRDEISRSSHMKSVINLGPTYAWEASVDFNAVDFTQEKVIIDLSHQFTPQEIKYLNKETMSN